MCKKQDNRRNLTITILSLSLLTVMAGAAVAPALDVIKDHFSDCNQMFVQMIISTPSIFIVLANMVFPRLCKIFGARELALAGLLLYVVGGCAAGVFDNIIIVLCFRAVVGLGVGIIMPMSTGLISFYFARDKQDKLMGYSSAMNQMGGVIATLLSGLLATISWRASFLVYLMGLLSMVLSIKYMPKEKIGGSEKKRSTGVFKQNHMFIIAMFLTMFIFFVYPAVFAIETAAEGMISQHFITIIMTGMDLIAFVSGLMFAPIKRHMGLSMKYMCPALFLMGYGLLFAVGGWAGTIIGSAAIGFANGCEIPFIISTASQRAGKNAATTVMPLISMAMYLAQFATPFVLSFATGLLGAFDIVHLPYGIAVICSVILLLWSATIKE